MQALTSEDIKNLIVLIGRSAYANLNEAKVGVLLEQKLRVMLEQPAETAEKEPTIDA